MSWKEEGKLKHKVEVEEDKVEVEEGGRGGQISSPLLPLCPPLLPLCQGKGDKEEGR